ncbi:MAG TPA: HAD-IA family hydrolase [Thiobacillaceae bacterium]|nr:HAD-IA family hydrolase [Thiobacillaceae bacterium]
MPRGAYKTILFDLDGTLVDTAPDLAATLNEMRARRGMAPLPDPLTRPQASHGTRGLLRVGFGLTPEDAGFETLRGEFLALYETRLTERSGIFPGIGELLGGLEAAGLAWGVVTNKPARYTEPLLAHLGLMTRAAIVVSGDTCAHSKPHPAPLLHACGKTASRPEECLYVGDAERDIRAATAAGMPALIALYGYLAEDDTPEEWGGSGLIRHPGQILDYL